MAAEYILKEGNEDVMLCERGIRTFETAYRFTLDLMAVPVLKELTHLPVVVDPSHAAGRRDLVAAAVAGRGRRGRRRDHRRGAPEPEEAICDGPQALVGERLRRPTPQQRRGARRRSPARSCRSGRARSTCRHCRPRRRADRRLDRPGRARAARAPRSPASTPTDGVLDAARERGAVDVACALGAPRRSPSADAAVVAAPVGALPAAVAEALDAAPRRLRRHRRRLDQARGRRRHPTTRASSAATRSPAPRRAGVEHARADLFDGATWYLTPTEATSAASSTSACTASSSALGAQPAAIDAERRTTALLAAVSHLPHVLANVLVAQAARGSADRRRARCRATGPSFRDATRVAGANSGIWTDIYLLERATRSPSADRRRHRAPGRRARARCAPATPTASTAWNDARRRRAPHACSRPALAGGPVHELRVSVPNRPGVVAQVALELGRAGVNIVDMALAPRRRHDERRGRPLGRRRRRRRPRRGADRRARLPGGAGMTKVRFDPVGGAARHAAPAAGQVDLAPRGAVRRR